MKQSQETQSKKPEEKSSGLQGFLQKFLIAIIVIAVAVNISLLQDYFKVKFPVQYSNGQITADYRMKFIGPEGIRDIASQISKYSDAKKVYLDLTLCGFTQQDAISLANSIGKLSQVKELDVSVSHNTIKNEGLLSFFKAFQNLKQLNSLRFSFDSIDINQEVIKQLEKEIPKLNGQIQKLHLSSIYNGIEDSGVEKLVNGIIKFKNLKNLGLTLISNNITKEGAKHLALLIDENKQLEDLYLNLYSNHILAEGAFYISKSLKELKNLKNLNLDFYFNNLTETGAEALGDGIGKLKQLQNLRLNLDFCYIENEGAEKLGKGLQELKNLQILKLGVAIKNFGPPGFSSITQSLQNLTSLTELELRVNVNKIGRKGVQDLEELLPKLTKLKILKLDLVESYFGDPGAYRIGKLMENLTNIEELYLNINFNDIKNWGARNVTDSLLTLAKKGNLKVLHFDIGQNEIKDDDGIYLAFRIQEIASHVKELDYSFMNSAVKVPAFQKIKEILEPIKNLELHINQIVTEESLEMDEKIKKLQDAQNQNSDQ